MMEIMQKAGKTSVPFVQNKLKVSYDEAIKVIDSMIKVKKENKYITNMNDYLNKLK